MNKETFPGWALQKNWAWTKTIGCTTLVGSQHFGSSTATASAASEKTLRDPRRRLGTARCGIDLQQVLQRKDQVYKFT